MNWTGSVLSLTVSLILSFKLKSHDRKVFVDHSYDKIALVLIHFLSVFATGLHEGSTLRRIIRKGEVPSIPFSSYHTIIPSHFPLVSPTLCVFLLCSFLCSFFLLPSITKF